MDGHLMYRVGVSTTGLWVCVAQDSGQTDSSDRETFVSEKRLQLRGLFLLFRLHFVPFYCVRFQSSFIINN